MIIWVRNIVVIFFLLSLVYAALSFLARLKQRDKLKAEFEQSDKLTNRDEFVTKGLQKYNASYRPKLIFSVYLVPFFIIVALLYLANRT